MPLRHIALAIIVMALWGTNFVAARIGLDVVAPTLLASLRFLLAGLPLMMLLPRPRVHWALLTAYAFTAFALQFTLVFGALYFGMPAGLASLVMQCQVFFTTFLAVIFLAERPNLYQVLGATVGGVGIAVVGLGMQQHAPLLPLLLTLGAALSWSASNLIVRRLEAPDPIALVVWGSGIASLFLVPLSLWLDGVAAWRDAVEHLAAGEIKLWGAVLYNVICASLLGYGGWSALLRRHPASVVAPFTLLVPIFGLSSAALLLGETVAHLTWAGAALVFVGLMVTQIRRAQD